MRDEKPAKPEGKSRAVASVKAENGKLIAIFNESEMQCGFGYADSHVRDEASVDEKQMLTKNEQINKVSIDYVREEKHAAWPRCENEGFL